MAEHLTDCKGIKIDYQKLLNSGQNEEMNALMPTAFHRNIEMNDYKG